MGDSLIKTVVILFLVVFIGALIFGVYKMFQRAELSQQIAPELGLTNNQFAPCPDSPNCVSSSATDEKHAIEPLPGGALEFNALAAHIAETKKAKILVLTDNYLHATYTSGFFGFVDDLELYDDETQIHVRSASREGYSDLGVNRKRVENLRTYLGNL